MIGQKNVNPNEGGFIVETSAMDHFDLSLGVHDAFSNTYCVLIFFFAFRH